MNNNHYTYMGPGSNIIPAVQYLRKRGATSADRAISLEEIESEDFRQLLKLNGQASMWIGVTPEGKYWVRSSFVIVIIVAIVIFLFILGVVIYLQIKTFSNIEDINDRINDSGKSTEEIIEDMKIEIEDY